MDSKKPLNLCGPSIRRLRIEHCNRVLSDLDLAKLARVLGVPVERLFPRR